MSSSYPHDRDWEIPPEERPASSTGNHKTPYTEPISQAAASQGPSSSHHVHRTSQRNGNGRLQRKRSRRAYYEDDEDDEPGILARLFKAIFAPILGFIIISGISLTWSALLFGALMAYTSAGNPLTGTVLLFSVLVWMAGFKILMSVLYYGN